MRVNVSLELKSRLNNAALNGSVIASDILAELKSGSNAAETLKGSSNFFSTKRMKTSYDGHVKIRIVFTACTKDITHEKFPDRNNPQAPWFPENRTDLEPGTFVECFKRLREYSGTELAHFNSALCLDSKVNVKLYSKMNDLFAAYHEANYSSTVQNSQPTLHNSCMRDEDSARDAADFYYHFAGAKIIVAKDAAGNILGRALVWENAELLTEEKTTFVSVLDRIYFTHDFIIPLIEAYAKSIGIVLRRSSNSSSGSDKFTALNAVETLEIAEGERLESANIRIPVYASRWHKKGVPYLDTFYKLHVTTDAKFYLANYINSKEYIASCQYTDGIAHRQKHFCPRCGQTHNDESNELCQTCRDDLFIETHFGSVLKGRTVRYKGDDYPASLFHKGRPKPFMSAFLHVQKLY